MTNYIYDDNNIFDFYDEIDAFEDENLKTDFQNSTFEIISKVAYLIGVPKRIFDNEYQNPQMSVFEELEKDKNARVIRHLCIIRTAIERCYKHLRQRFENEHRTFLTLPEYVPEESVKQLTEDRVIFFKKSNAHLYDQVIEINRLIADRINNCKALFPLWVDFSYIKNLFIMPNGLSRQGTEAEAKKFYANMQLYPYRMYINWVPEEVGNILFNDKKFLSLLYNWNVDEFNDFAKVSDAKYEVKQNIYDFIENGNNISVLVDCENSDPYKLVATLRNLDKEYTSKINSIVLFDDINTVSTWEILRNYTSIPVEHLMIERLKQNKSLVDATLIAKCCQLHYNNGVDSFIIVSSDSDYFALISQLNTTAKFLVMVEEANCGPDLKRALIENGIFYCYLDHFYTGNAQEIRYNAIFYEIKAYLKKATAYFNIKDMFREALKNTHVDMDKSEQRQFFEKYIKTIQMRFDSNGNVLFEFKPFY